MNKKLIICLMLGIFLISLVSAEQMETLGTFKQNECINLLQTCADCTFVNFTSVNYPNGSQALGNVASTKTGVVFNYTFCSTSGIGQYIVTGIGDVNNESTVFAYDFEITPNGFINSLGFYFLILILSLGLIVFGIGIGDAPITILGSFGLYFLGLYIMFYGLVGIKDTIYTWAIGIIILGLAFYVSSKSAYELITD